MLQYNCHKTEKLYCMLEITLASICALTSLWLMWLKAEDATLNREATKDTSFNKSQHAFKKNNVTFLSNSKIDFSPSQRYISIGLNFSFCVETH